MNPTENNNEIFKQDLDTKGDFQHIFRMHLLFTEKGIRPRGAMIQNALDTRFGKTDIVADTEGQLSTFAVWKFLVEYKDNQKVPAQVLMSDFEPFDENSINSLQRSQLWDCPEKDEILAACKYKLMLSDFIASGLEYKERAELLTGWLETTLELLPDCTAVWIPSSEKLLTREQVLDNPWNENCRFLHFGMNVRFFNIQGTNDMLVDTLGLYAIGLPDVQYHFHDLDPNAVVNHANNVAAYIFIQDDPIGDGETIAGLNGMEMDGEVHWKCQHELALIQPEREVMDICPREYASGGRE